MRSDIKKIISLFLVLLLGFSLVACTSQSPVIEDESQNIDNEDIILEENLEQEEVIDQDKIDEEGYYTSKEDVALYIDSYDKLPNNYLTKREASDLGWQSNEGNLWDVTDRMSIGGDRFGNREGLLPEKDGRQYYECDINYEGGYRGAERLVYSNDGLIYYTADHYESFELLYGEV